MKENQTEFQKLCADSFTSSWCASAYLFTMGVLHTPTLFQTIPGFYSLTETVKTKGTLLVRDTRESTFIQLQNWTKNKWRKILNSQNFILRKGSNFMKKIEWILMWKFYELNHIKFLNHVNLWLKINFQPLSVYLKGVTCTILDGDGTMGWSVDDLIRSILLTS